MKILPDIARQLLASDFENICAKLKAGGTMTTAERKMFEAHAQQIPEPAPPSAEAPPDPAPASAPLPSAPSTEDKIARWEATYATKRRQLFRYLAIGREKNHPCPLDHPEQMPAWWSACMKHRIKPAILAAAQGAARATGIPQIPAPQPLDTAPPLPSAIPATDPTSYDFLAQVERMRREQFRLHHQLDAARAGRLVGETLYVDQPAVESLLRQSLTLQESLRKAESDLTAWQRDRGQLAPVADVRAENARISGTIFAAVRRLVKTLRPQMAGLTDAAADQLWESETRRCFAALKEANFSADLAA